MKENTETTQIGRVRIGLGLLLSIVGIILLIAASIIAFTNLTLTFAAILFIVAGLLIAGSNRLGQLISDLLH